MSVLSPGQKIEFRQWPPNLHIAQNAQWTTGLHLPDSWLAPFKDIRTAKKLCRDSKTRLSGIRLDYTYETTLCSAQSISRQSGDATSIATMAMAITLFGVPWLCTKKSTNGPIAFYAPVFDHTTSYTVQQQATKSHKWKFQRLHIHTNVFVSLCNLFRTENATFYWCCRK